MKGNLQDLNLKLYALLEEIHDPENHEVTGQPKELTKEQIEKIKLTSGIANNIIGISKLQLDALKMAKGRNIGTAVKRISGCDIEVIESPVNP